MTILDNYQRHENKEPINDPDEFVKTIETRDPELIETIQFKKKGNVTLLSNGKFKK